MGSVVFNLIPTPCKPDEILVIIRIRNIKYGFMRVTSKILNIALDNLKTSIFKPCNKKMSKIS